MSDTPESVGSRGTTGSQLWEQFQKQLEIKKNKENMNDEDRDTLEGLQKEMKKIMEDNKEDLESVKSELRKLIGNDENIEEKDEEYNKLLAELGISQKEEVALKEEEEEEEETVEEEEETVEKAAPEIVGAVTATVSVDEIKNKLETEMNYKDVDIQIENNKINVKAIPVPPTGGKSKKKQLKPKNKSNKKMKKKQTKKGGKQIKKRSLKRKMKK